MSQFFYYQKEGGEDAWREGLAEARAEVVATEKPRYVTVLDLSELISEEMTREQIMAVRYRGPLYFDWDHTDIEFTIAKVQQFMAVLMEKGVQPEMLRWFATGGRGFHVEIPQAVFIAKPPTKGLPLLPLIYREMAFELYTDAMDMRVYSGRKGRMWRTPNVQRENGRYKVPVRPNDVLTMTETTYAEVCAAPREPVPLAAPVFNNALGLIFAKASSKVEQGAKRAASSKLNVELLKKFKGEWPPTLARILAGEGIAKDMGFHPIAMQLAITANALGKSEEALLKDAEGLCETHVSDGFRYNTPAKRRAELSRMYDYTRDNVCYSYAKDAVKKLVAPGSDTADLDGMSAEAGESLSAPQTEEEAADQELRGGLDMRERGIYKKDQEQGTVMICDLAFKDVRVLKSMPSPERPSELWGYEADVYLKGKRCSRQQVDMQVFLSKQRFQEFAMKNSGVMKGTDNDVASLSTILRDSAEKNKMVSYVTRREGFEIVRRPDTAGEQKLDMLWVQSDIVRGVELNEDANAPLVKVPDGLYIFRPMLPSGSLYSTDLWHAPELDASNDEKAFFEAFFGVNEPFVVGTLLGWLTACFHRSLYQHLFGQFPLLQSFGQAGSGKTQTAKLFTPMHYHNKTPDTVQTGGVTKYVLESHLSSSASVPCLLDEYKPREFSKDHRGAVWLMLRAAYDNGLIGKGGDKDQIGQSWKSISMNQASAPIYLIGEALETQTAILERSVAVPMSKAGLAGRQEKFRYASRHRRTLGRLGRSILQASFGLNFNAMRELTEKNLDYTMSFYRVGQDRPAMNMAIVLTGFDFMAQVMRGSYGGFFDTQLATMRESITDETKQISGTIMAEASKVMDSLANMSKEEETHGPIGLRPEHDYCFYQAAGDWFLDLRLDTAWYKYSAWCTAKSQEKLYDNFAAFTEGLAHYAPMVDKRTGDSRLRESGNTKIFRFNLTKLADEGVQLFKDQP